MGARMGTLEICLLTHRDRAVELLTATIQAPSPLPSCAANYIAPLLSNPRRITLVVAVSVCTYYYYTIYAI